MPLLSRMRMGAAALTAVLLLAATATAAGSAFAVMPAPASATRANGRLRITPDFTVGLAGHDDPRLRAGIARALRRAEERTTFTWARTPTGEYTLAQPASAATLVIDCAAAGSAVPALGDDESYTLTVTPTQAVLRAAQVVGVLRGLETWLQLLDADDEGWYVPAGEIKDAPRFGWRGLLLDPCRHWMPVEVIKRNLDAMAVVKLNVLHFHLTDDQGFRVESRRFPRLQELGSDGHFYTQEQVRDIVAYAADRGIRVVPEFDVPGHATSWVVAFPELASAPGPYVLARRAGVFDPVLDPTDDRTYAFLDAFFGEMVALFPDAYFHIGGDENNGRQWKANPRIQAFIAEHGLKDNAGLHTYFNQRIRGMLEKYGRKMVGWDEILQPDLPAECVVQSWRGPKGLVAAAKAGHPVLLSNGYYLDHPNTAAQYYANDPVPADTSLTPEEQRRVIGGEACMWAEWVSPETVDARIWPRAAAVAERLWSPRETADVPEMYARLARVSHRLSEAGALHEKNPPLMLRRLAGDEMSDAQFAAVRGVVEWVEAYGNQARGRVQRSTTQFTPLTRVVDCLPLESATARQFSAAVDRFVFEDRVENRQTAALIGAVFTQWTRLAHAATADLRHSPGLGDLPIAGDALVGAARIGNDALDVLAAGRPPAPGWAHAQYVVLDRLGASNPAALGFPFLVSVRRLVAAAAIAPERGSLSPEEWRRRIEVLEAPPKPAPKKAPAAPAKAPGA